MNLNLKTGDPCWVRVSTGDIVQAKYNYRPSCFDSIHWLSIDGVPCLATKRKPSPKNQNRFAFVRFVLINREVK